MFLLLEVFTKAMKCLVKDSKSRQCGFMALCSILFEQNNLVCLWSANKTDDILVNGDSLYGPACTCQLFAVSLSLMLLHYRFEQNNPVPIVVHLYSNNRPIVTCSSVNYTLLPDAKGNKKSTREFTLLRQELKVIFFILLFML